ncbi:MAG: hypothetical protein JXB32_12465 [Deltaproteobacteria bacterium]|nr:hypothetical protein [Deltaproteobacteria bacterium]
MRRMPSTLGALVLASLVPAAAAAQEPVVSVVPVAAAPTAGEGAVTELEFHSDEPGLVISFVPSGAEDTGLQLFPGARPDVAKPLCETPCRLQLPNGYYTFLAGGYQFELTAAGGTQVWDVEDESWGRFFGGIALVALGACGVLAGGMVLGFAFLDDPYDADMLRGGSAGLAVGAVAAVVGGLLWYWSYGTAERRPAAATPPAVAFGPGGLVLRF